MSRVGSLVDEVLKQSRQSGSPETWVDPIIVKYLASFGTDLQKQFSALNGLDTELRMVMARSLDDAKLLDVIEYIWELKRRLAVQIDDLGSGTG
jgi:hypothetical protein